SVLYARIEEGPKAERQPVANPLEVGFVGLRVSPLRAGVARPGAQVSVEVVGGHVVSSSRVPSRCIKCVRVRKGRSRGMLMDVDNASTRGSPRRRKRVVLNGVAPQV